MAAGSPDRWRWGRRGRCGNTAGKLLQHLGLRGQHGAQLLDLFLLLLQLRFQFSQFGTTGSLVGRIVRGIADG